MSKLYINNIPFPDVLDDKANLLMFLLNINTNQSNNIKLNIKLLNYHDKDIAQSYMYNLGIINTDKDSYFIDDIDKQIMLSIYAKYPHYVYLKDKDLTMKQINFILNNCDKSEISREARDEINDIMSNKNFDDMINRN